MPIGSLDFLLRLLSIFITILLVSTGSNSANAATPGFIFWSAIKADLSTFISRKVRLQIFFIYFIHSLTSQTNLPFSSFIGINTGFSFLLSVASLGEWIERYI